MTLYLDKIQLPTLSRVKAATLDFPVTVEEIDEANASFKLNKTPDLDGYPIESK